MDGELGKRIIKRFEGLCREQNINIYDLAALCGVTPVTIEKLMRGKTQRFSVATMKKLCGGLKINLAAFYDSDIFR